MPSEQPFRRIRGACGRVVERLEPRRLLHAGHGLETDHSGDIYEPLDPAPPVLQPLRTVTGMGRAAFDSFRPLTDLPAPGTTDVAVPVSKASPFSLNLSSLSNWLSAAPKETAGRVGTPGLVVALPSPTGTYERFAIWKSDVLAPALAAMYPMIQTFVGQGIDDPSATLALDYTVQGMHAQVLSGDGPDWYIDPYIHLQTDAHVAYSRSDMIWIAERHQLDWELYDGQMLTRDNHDNHGELDLHHDGGEGHEDEHHEGDGHEHEGDTLGGGELLRDFGETTVPGIIGTELNTYRLGVGVTGEYTAFHGGTVAGGLSAVTTSVTRLNQIYERDFAIRMQLIANQNTLIFTNAATDPYTSPGSASTSNTQNQSYMDANIGSANYDIGHVYHRGSTNGLAGAIGNVGVTGQKAKGYSSHTSPVNDPFTIDYVAHEMGHQYGGRHTFNNCGGGPGDSSTIAIEPGSGATIMAYAGICNSNENLQANSDAMFHAMNYTTVGGITPFGQIFGYTRTAGSPGYTSAIRTATGNTPPTADAGISFSIPISTPFALTAVGTDGNGDALTYSWEQMNGGSAVPMSATGIPSSTVAFGPVFRTYLPSTSPTRNFPLLNTILVGGTGNRGEQLPSVARTMNFTVVVRDNRAGGGGVALDNTTVTTVNTGAAFSITNFNTATTIDSGSTIGLTWNVANTTAAPINVSNVRILMSTDGGQSFPHVLTANTANDGSEDVTLPAGVSSSTTRFKVEPIGNIFFDINNANINVTPGSTSTPTGQPTLTAGSDTGVSNSDNITRLNNASPATALIFSVPNTISGATVRLYSDGVLIGSAVASSTTTLVTTNGALALANGVRAITARQQEPGKSESAASTARNVTVDTIAPAVLGTPAFVYATSPHRVAYSFSEDLTATLGSADFSALRIQDSANIPVSLATSPSAAQVTFSGLPVLPNGDYRVTLAAAGVTDIAGNPLASDHNTEFFFVMADANHDRTVDLADFGILRTNFGQSPRTFSQADFDYDSDVDLADFGILRANFGAFLPPPGGRGLFGGDGGSGTGSGGGDDGDGGLLV